MSIDAILKLLTLTFVALLSGVCGAWSTCDDATNRLAKELRQAYHDGGTIGVLTHQQLQQRQWQEEATTNNAAPRMVQAVMEASRGNKGVASGMLNAMIGSCCDCGGGFGQREASELARELMIAYDGLGDYLKPDLVALCLAYTATIDHDSLLAQTYLKRCDSLHPSTCRPQLKTAPRSTPDWENLEASHGIRLLHDTPDFAVLSKPSGLVCFHTFTDGVHSGGPFSLEGCLLDNGVPLSTLNMEGRGLVHRIDRGTSGCMVVAKTNESHALLLSQFFLRKVRKSYQALVSPKQLLSDRGVVVAPIQGRPAESSYMVQERISPNLVKVRVTTSQGRKHQVRLHCSKGLNAPILLDPLYGGRAIMINLKSPMLARLCANGQICLHSDSLCIPDFGIDVHDPTPQWWQDLQDEISER